MKVTLLIAMCTLVVLLQQMQTPMAKPQLSPNLPYKMEESGEIFAYSQQALHIYIMQLIYFHCIPIVTSQEIQIPTAEPQLSLRPPREAEQSGEWIFAHPQHVARYIAGIAYMMQLIYFHCMPLETLQYDFLSFFQWGLYIHLI